MIARHRIQATLATVVALCAMSACGIQTDSSPRDLPDGERSLDLSDGSTGAAAAGADRIFLVAPGDQRRLRSVPRDATQTDELLRILLRGPNQDEIDAQYSSLIPTGTRLLSTRTQGDILVVDLSNEITELAGQSLSQAIAQIVYTATEVDGIEAVELQVDGQPQAWPKPNGETTTSQLRTFDFPGFVQTAQPGFPAVPVAPVNDA